MNTLSIGVLAGLVALLSLAAVPAKAENMPMPVLGQTAQPVGHFDFCKRVPEECGPNRTTASLKMTRTLWTKLLKINTAVNGGIIPRTDQEIYGVAEYWAYPTTVGDCEDYVLLKQYMLERSGYPRSALLITVVKQANGEGHAVLTVRTDRGDFILDNLNDYIRDWKETGYRYLKRQSEANSAKWVSIGDDRNTLVGSLR